jgi:hypothetical protein
VAAARLGHHLHLDVPQAREIEDAVDLLGRSRPAARAAGEDVLLDDEAVGRVRPFTSRRRRSVRASGYRENKGWRLPVPRFSLIPERPPRDVCHRLAPDVKD